MAITPTHSLLQAIAEHAHRAIERPAPPPPQAKPAVAAPERAKQAASAAQAARADGSPAPAQKAAAAPGANEAAATPPRDLPRGSIVDILA